MKKVIDTVALLILVLAIADIAITIMRGSWEVVWAITNSKMYTLTDVAMKYEFSLFMPLSVMLLAGSLPSLSSYVKKFRVRYVGMASIIFMFITSSFNILILKNIGGALFLLVLYVIFAILFVPFLFSKWHSYELMLLGGLSAVFALFNLNFNFYSSSVDISILLLGILSFTAGYIVINGLSKRLENLVKIETVLLAIAIGYRFYVTGGSIL